MQFVWVLVVLNILQNLKSEEWPEKVWGGGVLKQKILAWIASMRPNEVKLPPVSYVMGPILGARRM